MRLIDLHPEFQACSVEDTSLYRLSFDCPVCGRPWRITIKARLDGSAGPEGVWGWTAAPFSNIPAVPLDWNTVSVTPSIRQRRYSAHGRKRECSAHFNIAGGEVLLSDP